MPTSTTYATKDASGMIVPTYDPDENPAQTSGEQLWNGTEDHFIIGRTTSSGFDYKGRGLVYFPLSFTGIDTLESAVLHFKQGPTSHSSHAEPGSDEALSMYVRRMLRDWGEGASAAEAAWSTDGSKTYTYKKTLNKYSTSGPQNWTDADDATWSGDEQNNNWESVDITDIVTQWWEGAPNYGLILINTIENTRTKGFNIYTRHSSGNVPYIVMTYNSNNAPNAPATSTLSPRNDAVVNTLEPTFTGQNNDPDSVDYITGVQVIAYEDNGTTINWDSGQIDVTGSPTTFAVQYDQVIGIVESNSLVGNTFYKWKVRTRDKGNQWSPYSALQRFKVNTSPLAPTLTLTDSPSNDVQTLTPTFQITHSDNDPGDGSMHGYQLIVEMSTGTQISDSGQVDLSGAPVATKSVTVGTLTPPASGNPWGSSYRAKARTKDSNGAWGPYSGYITFTTHITGAPTSLSPANDEVATSATPTLSGARASTTDTIVSYRILLYEDNNATVKWDSGTLTSGIVNGASFSKVYSGSALSQGSYYQWQALVTSSIGGTSVYTDKVRFRVPSDASVPTQSSPIATGIDDQPAFVGSRVATFNRYQIEVYPSTATTSNLGTATYSSGTQSATIAAGGLGTEFTLAAGTIPALAWNTTFKWRARVSADGGSTWSAWSGLASFTTDAAGVAVLTTPSSDQWITDATPDMTVTRSGSDTIDKIQIRVFASNGTTLLIGPSSDGDYATNTTDVANGNTGTWTYNGPVLSGGYYWWQARYQKSTGPWGEWSAKQRWRLNYAPSAPTELEPTPSAILIDTLLPTFRAKFNDNDTAVVGDEPSEWRIEVAELDDLGTILDTITVTSGLQAGVNEYIWDAADYEFDYGVDYAWRTVYEDSLGVEGTWSGWQSFRMAVEPNSTGLTPTTSYSEIATVKPTFSWTYDASGGSAQRGFNVKVYEVIDPNATTEEKVDGTDDEVLSLKANVTKVTGAATYQFESTSFFQTGKVYEVRLSVQNLDLIFDSTPQTVRWYINVDAPDPVLGLSPTTVPDRSLIELDWDTSTMKSGHTFVSYNVYKKLPNDEDWQYVGSTLERTDTHYDDWYAGHLVVYQYRVTVVTTKGTDIELESADDPGGGNISEAVLDSDVWMFVGADRDDTHIQELPVDDESHERIIQQESFEVLGAERKVVIRGFVLGNEGSISIIYINQLVPDEADPQNEINETIKGRRLLDYLTRTKGPHILKSPFGDVWDVEFEGPQYKWLNGGNLQVDLNWIETGSTSQVTL